ncbi:recombinase family protein [Agrobacterium tumefaciens]|uniref:recombinase family protein n=1 Tax=Agrobacterium tumefaciens TaxID=358 RepID=UPI00224445B6|nr:recombinase family protein [Agrobacterium tumefaciens]MCW8146781.1 recombinase family protein [Agrobacterium tumefaciens]
MTTIGYARVSTPDQNLGPQRDALQAIGCDLIFEDFGVSGVNRHRSGLEGALRFLKKGDTLVVYRLDRLGRSIGHLIDVVGKLQSRGVGFQSLTENIDTNSASGRMIFHVMAAVAEFERALIVERTMAGIAAARARGKVPGRRCVLTDEQCEEARRALQGGSSPREIAARFDIHPRTLMRAADRAQRRQDL